MNTKSTQRFVGMVVAVVATVLLLMALPSKPDPRVGESPSEVESAASGAIDPRDVLPVFEELDGWWVLTRYGMRMQLPEGWTPFERNRRPHAYRDMANGRLGSINVLSLPNFHHTSLADVAKENREALAANENLELIDINEFSIGSKNALRIDYRGDPAGVDMYFAAAVFLLGGHQVVVTAGATEADWPDVQAAVAESLGSIELLELPTMDYDELIETVDSHW